MPKRTVTIRDVAQRAGVSVSTVSRILTGAETQITISEETRERVLQAAQDLSYRPHPGARSLRGKSTNLLGVIVREIDDPFFSQLIRIICTSAREHELEIVLGHAEADPNEALRLSKTMLDLRICDGLFLIGDLQETPEDRTFLNKIGWSIPLVMICRGSGQLVGNWPSIGVDNRAGVISGLEYLTSLGHRRIAFLGGRRLGDLNERQLTYRQFMLDHFGSYDECYLQSAENSLEGGYLGMQALLSLSSPPSAVFASDDAMAIGAIKAAYSHGLRIPQDISLLGFDDIKMASYTTPALTTIRQPFEAIGQKAVEIVQSLIHSEGDHPPATHIAIKPELIIRDSCAPPK